jgi:hypothetical protein
MPLHAIQAAPPAAAKTPSATSSVAPVFTITKAPCVLPDGAFRALEAGLNYLQGH